MSGSGIPGLWLPKMTQPWPADARFAAVKAVTPLGSGRTRQIATSHPSIIRLYEQGFTGTLIKPGSRERFHEVCRRTGGYAFADEAATAMGWADSGAGKLTCAWLWQLLCWPGCLPGAAQECGDCVSHSASGAARLTIAGDIVGGMADQVTGVVEGVPDVDPMGIENGATASEYPYWWRLHNGDGWDCYEAATVVVERGVMLRNHYPDIGVDFREYSAENAHRYGSRAPGADILAAGKAHTIHTAAECGSREAVRDSLNNGCGISTCGNEGFSSSRDQWGFSRRSGSWSHGFKVIGWDERPEVLKDLTGGEPAVACDNNWGAWNTGGADVYRSAALVPALEAFIRKRFPGLRLSLVQLGIVNATTGNLRLPPGAWWCRWSDVKNRSFHAYAGIKGWARKKLPDLGGSVM